MPGNTVWWMSTTLIITVIAGLAASLVSLSNKLENSQQEKTLLQAVINSHRVGPTPDPEKSLGQFTMKTMEIVDSPLSTVERKVTAQQLVRIAIDMFETYDQRANWIVLLGIESKFDNASKSEVGAVGIGQIIPKFAEEFGSRCGLDGVTAKDLRNITVNATVSACQFRYLVEELESIPLALAAYNAGKYSTSVDSLKKLCNLNSETGSYIAKWTYVKEQATKAPPKKESAVEQRDRR